MSSTQPVQSKDLTGRLIVQVFVAAAAVGVLVLAFRVSGWSAGGWLLVCLATYLAYEVRAVARLQRSGDSEQGTVFWAESVRWLGVRWGLLGWSAGLRAAGFRGRIIPVDWHSGWRGSLVLPALMARRLMGRQAERLAERIAQCRRRRPHAPIVVIGYSCGAYVALEAARRLPDDIRLDYVVLIAAAVSPRYDLAPAAARVSGLILNVYSALDWPLSGLGLTLLGTADGRRRPGAGVVGFAGPIPENVRQQSWRPSFARRLYLGDHLTVGNAFFARHYAGNRFVGTLLA